MWLSEETGICIRIYLTPHPGLLLFCVPANDSHVGSGEFGRFMRAVYRYHWDRLKCCWLLSHQPLPFGTFPGYYAPLHSHPYHLLLIISSSNVTHLPALCHIPSHPLSRPMLESGLISKLAG